jgi:hypothetical protein
MGKILSDRTADVVARMVGVNRVDRSRESPGPRDLWVRGTSTATDPTDPEVPGGDANAGAIGHCYSFEAWSNEAHDGIIMEEGDVFLGPLTWVEWASITSASTTPTVSSTNTHVWLEIDVATPAAAMVVGSKADMQAALDATEQLTKTVCPLVATTWSAGVIVKVKGLQCGDVKLFRAAG